jgi:hypothetical protein
MAAAAVELDLDPEAVQFLFKERWVGWDRSLREDLAQRATEHCGQEAVQPTLPPTASLLKLRAFELCPAALQQKLKRAV